jgi:hypothetical protein
MEIEMTKHGYIVSVVVGAAIALTATSSANACGAIACALEQIAPDSGAGEFLDGMNDQLGHPAEEAVDDGLDYVLPGSGEAARLWQWHIQHDD